MGHQAHYDLARIARVAGIAGFVLVASAILVAGLRQPPALYYLLVLQPVLLLLAAAAFSALPGFIAGRTGCARRVHTAGHRARTSWHAATRRRPGGCPWRKRHRAA